MTPALEMMTDVVTRETGDVLARPDSMVANRFLTGHDSIPFHPDDEELFLFWGGSTTQSG